MIAPCDEERDDIIRTVRVYAAFLIDELIHGLSVANNDDVARPDLEREDLAVLV